MGALGDAQKRRQQSAKDKAKQDKPSTAAKQATTRTRSKSANQEAHLKSLETGGIGNVTGRVKSVHGGDLIRVDTHLCVPWEYHDRNIQMITQAEIDELAELIEAAGQQQPALVRKVSDARKERLLEIYPVAPEYEIIYGLRRWHACKALNVKLVAELVEFDDEKSLISMEMENAGRKNISPWEQGVKYKRWLDDGLFGTQDELCHKVAVKKSILSRVLKIATLPQDIVLAYKDTGGLGIDSGYRIAQAFEAASDKNKDHALAFSAQCQKSEVALSTAKITDRLIKILSEPVKKTDVLPPQKDRKTWRHNNVTAVTWEDSVDSKASVIKIDRTRVPEEVREQLIAILDKWQKTQGDD